MLNTNLEGVEELEVARRLRRAVDGGGQVGGTSAPTRPVVTNDGVEGAAVARDASHQLQLLLRVRPADQSLGDCGLVVITECTKGKPQRKPR